MNCAFCQVELNDGATVCHACRRAQPAIIARRMWWGIGVAAILLAAGIAGYFIEDSMAKEDAIEHLLACEALFGGHPNRGRTIAQLNQLIESGMNWRAALKDIGGSCSGE
jgi:hypothetical protein